MKKQKLKKPSEMNAKEIYKLITWAENEMSEYRKFIIQLYDEVKKRKKEQIRKDIEETS